ncbi:MAG: YbhB/YbcL family Raf kinase inhibitor-like protein [Xanthobacteraceae bacterium]|nr:YbhB/YbcL family Raf kinase inhibitor-like protein [Xanthobacteraceae bacterium]
MAGFRSMLFKAGIAAATLAAWPSAVAFADPLLVTSATFKDGGLLSVRNAGAIKANPNCVGENISPPLSWNEPPAGTRSFAFVVFDPDGRSGLGVYHWVAYGIPADLRGFAEGEVGQPSDKFTGGRNTAQQNVYTGPCPPANTGLHHYNFSLIATDLDPKALAPGLTRDELMQKLDGHAKGVGTIVGLFGR